MEDPSSCEPPLRHGFSSIQLPHYMPQEMSQATLHIFLPNVDQPLLQRPWCLLIGNVVKKTTWCMVGSAHCYVVTAGSRTFQWLEQERPFF